MRSPYEGYEWGRLIERLFDHPMACLSISAGREYSVRVDYMGQHWVGNPTEEAALKIQFWLENVLDRDTQRRLAAVEGK